MNAEKLEAVEPVDSSADAMINRLVEAHQRKLQNLRTNPKGMTHGDVQRDLAECARILG